MGRGETIRFKIRNEDICRLLDISKWTLKKKPIRTLDELISLCVKKKLKDVLDNLNN